jgi:hypothetical protein
MNLAITTIGLTIDDISPYRSKNMEIKTEEFEEGPIRHLSFPTLFLERVKNYVEVLSDVDQTSYDSALLYFQRDLNPEAELIVWEKIAATYQWAIIGNPGLTTEQKRDVYAILVGLSMGTKDFNNITNLSRDQITAIVGQFS